MPIEPVHFSSLADIIARLNDLSLSYDLGRLQALRKEVKGLDRRPTIGPFPSTPNNKQWAFHVGGRQELQFNIGLDQNDAGNPVLRYGVAFSLEPGQDLPDPEGTLLPLVAHFNDYIRAHADQLDDMRMWTWRGSARGPSRPLGPIWPDEARHGVFVFAGWIGPQTPTEEDLRAILRNFDRLMPLYETVLRGGAGEAAVCTPPLSPSGGTTMSKGKTRARIQQPARLVDVAFRHRAIQEALHAEMVRRHGADAVRHEHPTVLGGRVDIRVVENGDQIVYFEVKTAATARGCIREALGQLLEYAHWPGAEPVHELVVASDRPLTADAAAWLRELGDRYGLALRYYEVELFTD